jgi:hypothetical protein
LTAILHRAVMPDSWIIRVQLTCSMDKRDRVNPMQRRIMGS